METIHSGDAEFNRWVRNSMSETEHLDIVRDNPDLNWGWRMMAATLGEGINHELLEPMGESYDSLQINR